MIFIINKSPCQILDGQKKVFFSSFVRCSFNLIQINVFNDFNHEKYENFHSPPPHTIGQSEQNSKLVNVEKRLLLFRFQSADFQFPFLYFLFSLIIILNLSSLDGR